MMTTAQALDIAWILVAAALVMFMQAGFAALESGLVRTKNSINVAAKNFADFLVSSTVFWIVGFGLMFGASAGGYIGTGDFVFESDGPWLVAFFIFQLGFAGAAVTIVSGAVAERMRFSGYLLATLLMALLLYPVVGHWAWASASGLGGEGWLESIGFIDFAGSTVVHSVGGWLALAAILVIGPRIGRFGSGAVSIRGHDLPLVTVGVFILWFGWFGFNGGSTLAVTAQVPLVILNTTISAAVGGIVAMTLSWWRQQSPDVPTIMNGSLAGLVGITASANIVAPPQAAAIGAVAGVIMYGFTKALERLEVDDAVGAVPVHLGAGIWGTLAVALFGRMEAFGTGIDRLQQLGIQLVGIVAAFAWVFGLGYVLLRILTRVYPLRVDPAGEFQGLNVAEHSTSTELVDLLAEMDAQRVSGDYARPVAVEPNTEVGQIATQYNRVLTAINAETAEREAAAAALLSRTASLELLQRITAAVNEEPDLEEALRVSLTEVCAYAGWQLGHVYAVAADGQTLAPTSIWSGDDDRPFDAFRARTSKTALEPGVGLPGEAAAQKRPVLLSPPSDDPRLAGAGDRENEQEIRAGLAFPVLAGPDVVSVLEFYSEGPMPHVDSSMLDLMTSVGTQLGRAVERRRADEARFRTVVDYMPALVFLRDLDGRYLLVNRRYEEFYRVANDAIQGRTPGEVEAELGIELGAAQSRDQDQAVLASGAAMEFEIAMKRRPDGETAYLSSVKFPIEDATGAVVALGGIELDVTERHDHEVELSALVEKVQAARDTALAASQAKSQFLANMSHELRTPLNAIVGFTRIVARKTEGQIDQKQSDNLHKILVSAEHLMALINDILDLSRIEAGRTEVYPTLVELPELISEVLAGLEPIAGSRGLSLEAAIDGDLGPVLTDEAKVRQILVNLVGNALKFTERGEVTVHAAARSPRVRIAVSDTGIGIPAEALDDIFEEFDQVETGSTRRFGGTGLGLTISSRLARLLGGIITVESEPGTGSTFTLDLPRRYRRRPGAELLTEQAS